MDLYHPSTEEADKYYSWRWGIRSTCLVSSFPYSHL